MENDSLERLLRRFVYGNIFGIILLISVTLFMSNQQSGSEEVVIHKHDEHKQRELTVQWLQNYSDNIGFEGIFALDTNNDHIVYMKGTPLCSEDFPELVPPGMWGLIPAAGFTEFRCSYKDQQIRINIK